MGLDPKQCAPMLARLAANSASQKAAKLKAAADATLDGHEGDLHSAIKAECRRRGWLYFTGSMASRTRRTIGEPDFVILGGGNSGCTQYPVVYLVECKTRTGKLSPQQQAVIHAAAALGHKIHVVRSMREFLEIIK
jgi:hypothetical protein